jgi:uncharacterized membrane protein
MLLVVFCAMRPVGISGGSKIFGIGLGLGILAISDLVQTWWLATHPHMFRTFNMLSGIVICSVLLLWTAYFAFPEPERMAFDTGSPLARWNCMLLSAANK